MKIFYAVQATGNGHIARAIEILPYLQQYGQVDVFLSGSNSHLPCNLPVKYKHQGLSLFYNQQGSLSYWKMVKQNSLIKAFKMALQLPLKQYDIIINDFESITALACKLQNITSIGFGHQAAFVSPNTPLAKGNNWLGHFILKNYAPASTYLGLHFKSYDKFIYNPIIKQAVIDATPSVQPFITVYLSQYPLSFLVKTFSPITTHNFQIFSKEVSETTYINKQITVMPISNNGFTNSLINCQAVITGAGFETPAEALYLQKKLMCIPIQGQYEQLCNAQALKQFGVTVLSKIDHQFVANFNQFMQQPLPQRLELTYSTETIVQHAIAKALEYKKLKNKWVVS